MDVPEVPSAVRVGDSPIVEAGREGEEKGGADADRRKAAFDQPVIKKSRQRTGLHHHPERRRTALLQNRRQSLGIGGHTPRQTIAPSLSTTQM
jgi:hypothetical protein